MNVGLFSGLVLLAAICESTGYKILVYNPQQAHSHVTFLGHIADTLVKAGHDVVVYLPAFNDKINITGVKHARTIVRPRDFDLPFDYSWFLSDVWTKDGDSLSQIIKMMHFMFLSQVSLCEAQFADQDMLQRLRDEKFDLGIVEVYSTCGYALLDKIGVTAYVSSFATNMIEQATMAFGIDNNPSYVPGSLSELSDEMTYIQRFRNFATTVISKVLMKKYVPSIPYYATLIPGFNLREKMARSAFVFVNSDEYLEFPRPINHKVVYIGGIGVQKPHRLPEEYLSVMEQAKGPIVLVSFGSAASSSKMPPRISKAFLHMFSNLPEVTFIWKYEVEDNFASNLTNVLKRKWLPQNDLLAHPKMSAFISHGGLNSVTESTHAGVPIVCIPLFGDQMRNAKMVEKRGVGYLLDKEKISAKALTEALSSVLYRESYKIAAKRLAKMIHKKPVSVQERLVKHIEFAAEFKDTENLLPASTKLNFFQYYLLDIILPIFVLALMGAFTTLYVFIRLISRFIGIVKLKKD